MNLFNVEKLEGFRTFSNVWRSLDEYLHSYIFAYLHKTKYKIQKKKQNTNLKENLKEINKNHSEVYWNENKAKCIKEIKNIIIEEKIQIYYCEGLQTITTKHKQMEWKQSKTKLFYKGDLSD